MIDLSALRMRYALIFLIGIFAATRAGASPEITNLFSFQSVPAGTTNSQATIVGAMLPATVYYVQFVNIPSTNALPLHAQATLDGTNWFTYATSYPSRTNAGIYKFVANTNWILGRRLTFAPTNSMSIGVDQLE